MESENTPLPEPSGALVPPPRNPPTALAVSTPPPPRRPRNPLERFREDPRTKRFVDNAITTIFDTADALGDGIAKVFGLRPRSTSSVTPTAPPTPTRADPVD
jgi:hypothetical protein